MNIKTIGYSILSSLILWGCGNDQNAVSSEEIYATSETSAALLSNPDHWAHALHKDENPSDGQWLRPIIKIKNTGATDISDLKARYYFQTEGQSPQLEDWSTPNCAISLESLGDNNYAIVYDFAGYTLKAGTTSPEAKVGIHYPDWSTMDKTNDYSFSDNDGNWVMTPKIELFDGDETINVDYENVPEPVLEPGQIEGTSLKVFHRDENPDDNQWIRPRIYVENNGTDPISNFKVMFHFKNDGMTYPILENWSIPNCTSHLKYLGESNWVIIFDYTGFTLFPGQSTPEVSVGIHYENWETVMDPTNDYSYNGNVLSYTLNERIGVENYSGTAIYPYNLVKIATGNTNNDLIKLQQKEEYYAAETEYENVVEALPATPTPEEQAKADALQAKADALKAKLQNMQTAHDVYSSRDIYAMILIVWDGRLNKQKINLVTSQLWEDMSPHYPYGLPTYTCFTSSNITVDEINEKIDKQLVKFLDMGLRKDQVGLLFVGKSQGGAMSYKATHDYWRNYTGYGKVGLVMVDPHSFPTTDSFLPNRWSQWVIMTDARNDGPLSYEMKFLEEHKLYGESFVVYNTYQRVDRIKGYALQKDNNSVVTSFQNKAGKIDHYNIVTHDRTKSMIVNAYADMFGVDINTYLNAGPIFTYDYEFDR